MPDFGVACIGILSVAQVNKWERGLETTEMEENIQE